MEHDSVLTQVALCLIASGCMISSGMNIAFPAVALPALRENSTCAQTNISHEMKAPLSKEHHAFWIVILPQITMIVGCLSAGPILDWKGRKIVLTLSTFLASTGWLLMALIPKLWIVYLCRHFTCFAMGLASPAVSVYVSEIASPSSRSALTVIKMIAVSLGLTLTFFFGYLFRTDWKVVCLLCGIFPTVCFILVVSYLPEPRIWKDRSSKPKIDFMRPEVIKPMAIMSGAFIMRQISGTSAFLPYAVEMVKQAGVSGDWYLVAVFLGVARLMGSCLGVFLSSRLGRRLPATWSGVSMSASVLALATTFRYPVLALFIHFLSSSIHGSIPQAMVAEVFPTDLRGVATSVTTVVLYLTAMAAISLHEYVLSPDPKTMFTYYGCTSVASTLYLILFLPETHNKTLKEIEFIFNKKLEVEFEKVSSVDPDRNGQESDECRT